MTLPMTELRERLARALDRPAFDHVPSDPIVKRGVEKRRNRARDRVDAILSELSDMGMVVVPKEAVEEVADDLRAISCGLANSKKAPVYVNPIMSMALRLEAMIAAADQDRDPA